MKDHHFFAGSEDDTVETERPFHSENERNLRYFSFCISFGQLKKLTHIILLPLLGIFSNCPLRKMLREFPGRRSSSLTDLRKIEINRNLNLNVSKSQESISISKSDISYGDSQREVTQLSMNNSNSHLPDVWENYERRQMVSVKISK